MEKGPSVTIIVTKTEPVNPYWGSAYVHLGDNYIAYVASNPKIKVSGKSEEDVVGKLEHMLIGRYRGDIVSIREINFNYLLVKMVMES